MRKLLAIALHVFLFASTANAALTVTNVNPNSGLAIGGNTVTISGTDLLGVDYIDFNGYVATIQASGRTNTQMTVVVPNAYTWGAVDISVFNSTLSEYVTRTSGYTYLAPVINTVLPNQGSVVGGTPVTISGSNFVDITGVVFDGNYATSVNVVNTATITAVTPVSFRGAVPVLVQLETTVNTADKPNAFTYTSAAVSSVEPSSGSVAGGANVNLIGTGLNAVAFVYIDGNPVTITSKTDTSIHIMTPPYMAGTWNIQIKLSTGDILETGRAFTYVAPTVTAMNPILGPLAGGTLVTLTGTNLLAVSAVTIDSVSASITSHTDSSISITTPIGGSPGTKEVAVELSTGDSILTDRTFTYINDIPVATTYMAGDIAPRGSPNNELNVADILVLQRIVKGMVAPTELESTIADVAPVGNGNHQLDVADIMVLQRAVNGLVTLPPVTVGINASTTHINETTSGTVTWGESVYGETHTVFGSLTVPAGSTLTVAAGARVEVDGWSTINVNGIMNIQSGAQFEFGNGAIFQVSGTLKIQGTSLAPAVFSSMLATPAPASWSGIVVRSGAKVEIDYAFIEYAGNGITFQPGSSPLTNQSYVSNSTIRNNTVGIACNGDGVTAANNPRPLVNQNGIYDNEVNNYQALSYRDASSIVLDAKNNWWGSIDGHDIVGKIYSNKNYPTSPKLDISPILNASRVSAGNVLIDSPISNVTLSGTSQIIGSYTIPTGITVTIASSSQVNVDNIQVYGILTAQSGSHFIFGGKIDVYGTFNVQGASSSPVLFNSDPGIQWTGITIFAGGTANISNALIERANTAITFNGGGGTVQNSLLRWNTIGILVMSNSSPSISGNTFTENQYGIYVQGTGNDSTNPRPIITGNNIYGNTSAGLYVVGFGSGTSIVLNATGNWWGSATPSGNAIVILGNTSLVNSSGALSAPSNEKKLPGINSISVYPERFSPNGDGNNDTTTLSFDLSGSIPWVLAVKDYNGTTIRTYSGTGDVVEQIWDGRNTTGSFVSDGTYALSVTASMTGTAVTATSLVQVVVNTSAPIAEIAFPAENISTWNRVEIRGTANDVPDFEFYTINIGHYVNQVWQSITTKTSYEPVVNSVLTTWDTNSWADVPPVANGTYVVRLNVYDQTGNMTTLERDFIVDNIQLTNVSHDNEVFHPLQGEHGKFTFTLNKTADVTVRILPELSSRYIYPIETAEQGAIRIMAFTAMNVGAHTIEWDGRDNDGNYVKDEIYIYLIEARDTSGRFSKYSIYPTGIHCTRIPNSTVDGEFNAYKNVFFTLLINYEPDPECSNGDIRVGYKATFDTFDDSFLSEPLEIGSAKIYWDGHSKTGVMLSESSTYSVLYGGIRWDLSQTQLSVAQVNGQPWVYSKSDLELSPNHFWVKGATATVPVPSLKSDPYRIDLSYNQVTEFSYSLDQAANVSVKIRSPDLQREWTLLDNVYQSAGDQRVTWDNIPIEIGAEPGHYTFEVVTHHPVTGHGVTRRGNISIFR